MDTFIFELVGPYYELARAEVRALLERMDIDHDVVSTPAGLLILKMSADTTVVAEDLGLIHRVHEHISTFDSMEIEDESMGQIVLPEGSAAVETRRVLGKTGDTKEIKEALGGCIPSDNPIDLDDPDHLLMALLSDELVVGRVLYETDKGDFQEREVKNRPFFSPVSLEPRYARVLINLARPEEDDTLCDPFCGTGGLLIEAANMGLDIYGGDIVDKMVEGCRENLAAFGVEGRVEKGDFEETIRPGVDCIATDPPYGRASPSSGEDLTDLYRRFLRSAEENLKTGGHLAVIFPKREHWELGTDLLTLVERYRTRVHASLERHYCVFRKD